MIPRDFESQTCLKVAKTNNHGKLTLRDSRQKFLTQVFASIEFQLVPFTKIEDRKLIVYVFLIFRERRILSIFLCPHYKAL